MLAGCIGVIFFFFFFNPLFMEGLLLSVLASVSACFSGLLRPTSYSCACGLAWQPPSAAVVIRYTFSVPRSCSPGETALLKGTLPVIIAIRPSEFASWPERLEIVTFVGGMPFSPSPPDSSGHRSLLSKQISPQSEIKYTFFTGSSCILLFLLRDLRGRSGSAASPGD